MSQAYRDQMTLRGWENALQDRAFDSRPSRPASVRTYRDTDPRSDLAELVTGHFAGLTSSGDFDTDQAVLARARLAAVADAMAKGWVKSVATEEAEGCAARLAAEWLEAHLAYVAEAL